MYNLIFLNLKNFFKDFFDFYFSFNFTVFK